MVQPDERPNVTVVRRIYEALANRDVPGALALFAPDIEMTQSDEVPWGGVHRGHEGAMQFFAKLVQAVSSTVVADRYIDAGERVVVVGRSHGTMNATGRPFDVPIAHVWTVRDGKATAVVYCIDYPTVRPALEPA